MNASYLTCLSGLRNLLCLLSFLPLFLACEKDDMEMEGGR